MNEQKPSIMPIAIKYGVIMAIISFMIGLVSTYTFISGGLSLIAFGSLSFVIGIVIMIVFLVLGYREFKNANGGYMKYGQGLALGTLLVFVSGLIAATLTIAYFQLIDPDAQKQVAEVTIEKTNQMMESNGMEIPDEVQEQQRQSIEDGQSPVTQFLTQAGGSLVIGFIVSLIMAAIMKKSEPDY